MFFKRVIRGATVSGMLVAIVTLHSAAALAVTPFAIGELAVAQRLADGPSVLINGEAVTANGRTVFNGSLIITPAETQATLSIGNAGRLEIGPNSALSVTVTGEDVSAVLTAGNATLTRSARPVSFHTLAGDITLNAGETANANGARAARDHRDSTGKCIDDDGDGKLECGGGVSPYVWVALVGGAAAVILIAAATAGSDNNNVSPVR